MIFGNPARTVRVLLCIIMCVAAGVSGYADDIDDLFSEPDDFSEAESGDQETPSDGEDASGEGSTPDAETAPEPDSDDFVDLDSLATRDPKFSGSVNLEGGVLYGLDDWPGSPSAPDTELTELLSGSAFYDMSTSFSLDVRPASHIRFFGAASINLNTDTLTFKPYSINELFVDYTLAGNYFFRIGKQGMTWGQGRLLGNPGNLVSGIRDGIAVRSFIPVAGSGITAAMYAKEADLQGPNLGPAEITYAAQYEAGLGDVAVGSSARYRHADEIRPLHAAVYAKTPVLGADITLEGAARFEPTDPLADPHYWIVGNVFWEGGSPSWRVIGEYQYGETESASSRGHQAALAVQAPKVLQWTPALRWKHSFTETAGEVVAGIDRQIAPNLRTSIGIPVTYGPPESHYRTASDVPGNRVAALVARLNLSLSF